MGAIAAITTPGSRARRSGPSDAPRQADSSSSRPIDDPHWTNLPRSICGMLPLVGSITWNVPPPAACVGHLVDFWHEVVPCLDRRFICRKRDCTHLIQSAHWLRNIEDNICPKCLTTYRPTAGYKLTNFATYIRKFITATRGIQAKPLNNDLYQATGYMRNKCPDL